MTLLKKSGDWVLIKKRIPVEIPIDPMSIYYALPTGEILFNGEDRINGDLTTYWKYSDIFTLFGSSSKVDKNMIKNMVVDILRKSTKRGFSSSKLNRFEKEIFSVIEENNITLYEFEEKVKIKTIFGDVVLNPNEYSIIKDIKPYVESVKEKSAVLRFLSNTKQLTGKLNDQIFYLRSRGIGFTEALQLCISNIKTQNLFFIEMTPPNAEYYTRDYLSFAIKKLEYLKKNDREDLLEYPEYHLQDYIDYLKR